MRALTLPSNKGGSGSCCKQFFQTKSVQLGTIRGGMHLHIAFGSFLPDKLQSQSGKLLHLGGPQGSMWVQKPAMQSSLLDYGIIHCCGVTYAL